MVYTQTEKERMDRLLKAFETFVQESRDIDVAYADKTGYVRLIVADCADSVFFTIDNFDDMLSMFTMDVVYEEVEKAYKLDPTLTNRKMDYEIPRKRMRDYVSVLVEDREYALEKIEEYIAYWRDNELLP